MLREHEAPPRGTPPPPTPPEPPQAFKAHAEARAALTTLCGAGARAVCRGTSSRNGRAAQERAVPTPSGPLGEDYPLPAKGDLWDVQAAPGRTHGPENDPSPPPPPGRSYVPVIVVRDWGCLGAAGFVWGHGMAPI